MMGEIPTPRTDEIALRLTGEQGLFCDGRSLAQYNDLLALAKRLERELTALRSVDAEGWIAVSERLPDDSQATLIAMDDGEVWTGYHEAGEWCYLSGDTIGAKVTHWRNLPAAPALPAAPGGK